MIGKISLRPYLVVFAPSAGVSNVQEVKNVPLLFQNEGHMLKVFLQSRTPPPLCLQYLARQNVTHVINNGLGIPHSPVDNTTTCDILALKYYPDHSLT